MRAATVGTPCEEVDAAARAVIAAPASASSSCTGSGTASAPRRTRTRTWSRATTLPLEPGHAFSVEPGIYFPGRFGMRLEDIVVATDRRTVRLNDAPRDIAIVA